MSVKSEMHGHLLVFGMRLLDQGLFSVRALVFDLAQLTSQKRFDGGYEIIEPSTTFLGTSYGQIVVAVFT